MNRMHLKPLPFSRLRLIRAPFIYENPKRWLWRSETGNPYYNLWVCRSGHAKFRFKEQIHNIRPWTVLVIPPETPFFGWNEEAVPDYKNFSAHWVPLDVENPVFAPTVLTLREIDTAEALIQSMLRISAYGDRFGQQQMEWLLLSLIAMAWRETQLPWDSPADAVILSQIGRIRSGEGLFSDVTALAGEANMSRVHYTRRFKRALGLSPNEFL
ncbi:MAG TPA: AraC family ligand binding domain-containing protein, partial [Opitutales bacterium]|nr:AraC family ligand binding domain-containing protein [Opitutales bacterium]